MIVKTPYTHVQAIRRMYRDAGKATWAKPGGYGITLNFPAAGPSLDTVTGSVVVDSDSDFIWLSSYLYTQAGVWNPEVSANGEEADIGLPIKVTLGWTGEQLTTPASVPFGSLTDSGMCSFGTTTGFGGSEALEAEGAAQRMSPGIWRQFLPEPIIVKASNPVIAEIGPQIFVVDQGFILYLSGVRLFSSGG